MTVMINHSVNGRKPPSSRDPHLWNQWSEVGDGMGQGDGGGCGGGRELPVDTGWPIEKRVNSPLHFNIICRSIN